MPVAQQDSIAVRFGRWCSRRLPDGTSSGKLQTVGRNCLILLLIGIGVWLLVDYQFAWYLLGATVIGVVFYASYLAWKMPQKGPAKISSWYWYGVYLGAGLIGIVALHAGSQAERRAQRTRQPQVQATDASNADSLAWRKVIEGALLLLGIYIIKESSRAAVLAELTAEGRLLVGPAKPSEPSAPSVVHQSSSTTSQKSKP